MIPKGEIAAWWQPDKSGPALLDISLGAMLDQQAAAFAGRPAITMDEVSIGKSCHWTYAELKERADLIARGLMTLGVQAGDHVGLMAQNCAAWIELEYALAKTGAVLVTINPGLLETELSYLLRQGQIDTLIFTPQYRKNDIAGSLRKLMPDLVQVTDGDRNPVGKPFPKLKHFLTIGPDTPAFAMPYEALRDMGRKTPPEALAVRQAAVCSTDVSQIQYTSGTTGKPKGAMLTHDSTINNARLVADRGGFTETDVLLSPMPLFHTAGCVVSVMTMLACGGHLVMMDSFEPRRMLQLWQQNAPTILNAVPTMLTRLLEHPDRQDFDLSSLRKALTGGTTIPPSLMRRMREETGADPLILMGMTECSPVITLTNPTDSEEDRVTTAGIPLSHTEIRIMNPETGAPCNWGESGELWVRGYLTMAGYFDMPEKTSETLDAEGWLHSGDLAELSRSGHLRIVGRLKDMIIRGGENVYPVEIENCLLSHLAVSEAQVVSVPDPDLGEEIYAYVVLVPGAAINPEELQQHCRLHMARHKMPKFVEITEKMPLTANGKVQKFALREAAIQTLAARAELSENS